MSILTDKNQLTYQSYLGNDKVQWDKSILLKLDYCIFVYLFSKGLYAKDS